jgi:hypothetical protein
LAQAIEEEDFATAAKEDNFKSNGNQKVRDWLNKSYRFRLANAAAVMPKGCRADDAKKAPQ